MNKLSALMLLFLTSCSVAAYSGRMTPLPPGLTLQEVEQRHHLIYRGSNAQELDKTKGTCNGFVVSETMIYTAEHCVKKLYPFLEDGRPLEKLVSLHEQDIAILGTDTIETAVREAPVYTGKLDIGDEAYIVVQTSQENKRELLRDFPKQVRQISPELLEIKGEILAYHPKITSFDSSCNKIPAVDLFFIDAPGRLGFSGSPVFVKRDREYYLFGLGRSVRIPGHSFCNGIVAQDNAITFSVIPNPPYTELVRVDEQKKDKNARN